MRTFNTTTDFINNHVRAGGYAANDIVKMLGYSTQGGDGGARWKATGNTITASQDPITLNDIKLSDASGNEFELVLEESGIIDLNVLGGTSAGFVNIANAAGLTFSQGLTSDVSDDVKSFDTLTNAIVGIAGLDVGNQIYCGGRILDGVGAGHWTIVDATTVTENEFNIVTGDGAKSFQIKPQNNSFDAAQITDLVIDGPAQTSNIEDAITVCHDLGSGTLGTDWVGTTLRIPSNTVWDYLDIVNTYDGDVSATGGGLIATLSGSPGFTVNELVGAWLENATDGSQGTITENTADTVTVAVLRKGTNDVFAVSDVITISKMKVGVTIDDHSKYDPINARFTGQFKRFLNADGPSTTAANEDQDVSQHHTAKLVVTVTQSDIEARASFLTRRIWALTKKIISFFQHGQNPLDDTDSVANPGAAADILSVGGHDLGNHSNSASSQILGGIRSSDDMNGAYHAINDRARDNKTLVVKQPRNEELASVWDAAGTQRTNFEFQNAGVESSAYIKHWEDSVFEGFTGGGPIVRPITSSETIDTTLYEEAWINNEAATGLVTASLPSTARIGYPQHLHVEAAQTLVVQVLGGGITLENGDTTRRSSTVNSKITVMRMTATKWTIHNEEGTWAT